MMKLFGFWSSHRLELATLAGQHVLLVAVSTIVAIAIGVPLGIFASRRPRIASPLVGLANVVQTIPSLAMFGFLLPIPLVGGIGVVKGEEGGQAGQRHGDDQDQHPSISHGETSQFGVLPRVVGRSLAEAATASAAKTDVGP